jgi:hypothetical protein
MHVTVHKPQSFFHGILRFSSITALQTHGNLSPAKPRFDEIISQQKVKKHEPLAALESRLGKGTPARPIPALTVVLVFDDLDAPTMNQPKSNSYDLAI